MDGVFEMFDDVTASGERVCCNVMFNVAAHSVESGCPTNVMPSEGMGRDPPMCSGFGNIENPL